MNPYCLPRSRCGAGKAKSPLVGPANLCQTHRPLVYGAEAFQILSGRKSQTFRLPKVVSGGQNNLEKLNPGTGGGPTNTNSDLSFARLRTLQKSSYLLSPSQFLSQPASPDAQECISSHRMKPMMDRRNSLTDERLSPQKYKLRNRYGLAFEGSTPLRGLTPTPSLVDLRFGGYGKMHGLNGQKNENSTEDFPPSRVDHVLLSDSFQMDAQMVLKNANRLVLESCKLQKHTKKDKKRSKSTLTREKSNQSPPGVDKTKLVFRYQERKEALLSEGYSQEDIDEFLLGKDWDKFKEPGAGAGAC